MDTIKVLVVTTIIFFACLDFDHLIDKIIQIQNPYTLTGE